MNQNTDPFPTPRGALSPDGVTAAAPQWPEKRVAGLPWPAKCRHCGLVTDDPDAFFQPTDLDPLTASHECPSEDAPDGLHELERRYPEPLGVPGYAGAKGAVPEPQWPTTPSGKWLAVNADGATRRRIIMCEAEARAATPPDIDVDELALAMWAALSDRGVLRIDADSPKELDDIAKSILAELRRLALPPHTPGDQR